MGIERHFLGWDGPCLAKAVAWLLDRYPIDPQHGWDLSHLLIVVSGARSGRRLREHLVQAAQQRLLVPPTIITSGELPEHLYTPSARLADPWTCRLVRANTLGQTESHLLEPLLPQRPKGGSLG